MSYILVPLRSTREKTECPTLVRHIHTTLIITEGPGGSMSQVVGLPNNSYKPITNTAWVRARLCKLQKGFTRLAAASDKAYQLLAHGRWFSPGTPASSSTTKAGRHDIAEILLKVALSTINQIKSNLIITHMEKLIFSIIDL